MKSAFDLRVERTVKRLVNRDFAPSGNSDRPYKEVPTMDAEDARTATPPAREGIFRHSAAHFLAAIVVFIVSGPFVAQPRGRRAAGGA